MSDKHKKRRKARAEAAAAKGDAKSTGEIRGRWKSTRRSARYAALLGPGLRGQVPDTRAPDAGQEESSSPSFLCETATSAAWCARTRR